MSYCAASGHRCLKQLHAHALNKQAQTVTNNTSRKSIYIYTRQCIYIYIKHKQGVQPQTVKPHAFITFASSKSFVRAPPEPLRFMRLCLLVLRTIGGWAKREGATCSNKVAAHKTANPRHPQGNPYARIPPPTLAEWGGE